MLDNRDTRIAIREADVQEPDREALLVIAATPNDDGAARRDAIARVELAILDRYITALKNGLAELNKQKGLIQDRLENIDRDRMGARDVIAAGGGFGIAGLLIAGPFGAGTGLAFVAAAKIFEHNENMAAMNIMTQELAIAREVIAFQTELLNALTLNRRNRTSPCAQGVHYLFILSVIVAVLSLIYSQCASHDECSSHLPRFGR